MEDRWRQWRDAHPPRGYVWQRLKRIKKTHGLPRDTSVQIAGGMWTRRRRRRDSGSRAGGASGASAGRGVTAEFLCVPCAQRIEVGQDAAAIGKADDLFVYQDSASGELFQQTTSVRRWFELAKTHPGATAFFTSSCRQRPARDDERGRAVEGDQGGRILWLSLAVSGKEFRAGISTEGVASSLVACWWCPEGSDWDPAEIQEARRAWLDLCEADGNEAFGASTRADVREGDADSAAAGAASGAPEGREKKIAPARGPDVDVCLSESNSPSGEASNSQQSVSSGTLKREGWPVRTRASSAVAFGTSPATRGAKASFSMWRGRSRRRSSTSFWASCMKHSRAWASTTRVSSAKRFGACNLPLAVLSGEWSAWIVVTVRFGTRCEAGGI